MLMKANNLSIFVDIEASQYHADKNIVGHSGLVKMLQSPAHFWHSCITPHEPTAALAFGTAVHAAVLEPNLFSSSFVAAPKFDRRTKQGKEDFEQWSSQNQGKTIITDDDLQAINGITASIAGHKKAQEFLGNCVAEKSFFWKDLETGIDCRIRPDALLLDDNGEIIGILDLKTTRDASSRAFARSIANFGYDLQAAFYQDAVALAIGRSVPFYFLTVESTAPHGVALYKTGDRTLGIGRSKYRAALQMLQWCRDNNSWPSYQPFGDVEEIDVAHWEKSLEEDC